MNLCLMRVIAPLLLLLFAGDAYSYSFGLQWTFETKGAIGPPVLADINGDGKREIAFTTIDGFAYVLSSDGELMWSFMTGGRRRLPTNFGLIPGLTVADLERMEPQR